MKEVSIFKDDRLIKEFQCEKFIITQLRFYQSLEFIGVPSKKKDRKELTVFYRGAFTYEINDFVGIAEIKINEPEIDIIITW